ncbi:MAG: 2-C-methyl-D-erythritol 4-phosphate cytidylyltransferase [Gemmatimonadetes bacterium]|nr:2-C-methyl-D-erythritol 4-phosphate cytidylyltransferase [Gemmatimonadota bacterium]
MTAFAKSPGRRSGVAVLIPAAGIGARMGGSPKSVLELRGRTLLEWAADAFLPRGDVVELVVALADEHHLAERLRQDRRIGVVRGGDDRFGSVANALEGISCEAEIVVVHDAARPFPPEEVIDRCVRIAHGGCGAVAGIHAVDTVKVADEAGRIVRTPSRKDLWYAQTPQAFPRTLLEKAVAHCRSAGISPTDDASAVEEIGGEVRMVPSSALNLKVTYPSDIAAAEAYLERGLVP